jgi:hypothetical protein
MAQHYRAKIPDMVGVVITPTTKLPPVSGQVLHIRGQLPVRLPNRPRLAYVERDNCTTINFQHHINHTINVSAPFMKVSNSLTGLSK